MANYQNLLNSIAAVIKTNGNQEITGAVLQSTLQSMVSVMGANATYGGVAHPTDSPGTPDGPVVYVASEGGIYTNFGAISIDTDELAMLLWNPTTGTWSKESLAYIADKSEIEQLIQDGVEEINDAKDDALEEIGQIVQNVDVTYETISDDNVQLKNGNDDLLMPKTNAENVTLNVGGIEKNVAERITECKYNEVVNLAGLTINGGYISTAGQYKTSSTSKSIILPASQYRGMKVRVDKNPSTSTGYFALLRNNTGYGTSNGYVSFCTGHSLFSLTTSITYGIEEIPDDCEYIYLSVYNGTNYPSVSIYDDTNSLSAGKTTKNLIGNYENAIIESIYPQLLRFQGGKGYLRTSASGSNQYGSFATSASNWGIFIPFSSYAGKRMRIYWSTAGTTLRYAFTTSAPTSATTASVLCSNTSVRDYSSIPDGNPGYIDEIVPSDCAYLFVYVYTGGYFYNIAPKRIDIFADSVVKSLNNATEINNEKTISDYDEYNEKELPVARVFNHYFPNITSDDDLNGLDNATISSNGITLPVGVSTPITHKKFFVFDDEKITLDVVASSTDKILFYASNSTGDLLTDEIYSYILFDFTDGTFKFYRAGTIVPADGTGTATGTTQFTAPTSSTQFTLTIGRKRRCIFAEIYNKATKERVTKLFDESTYANTNTAQRPVGWLYFYPSFLTLAGTPTYVKFCGYTRTNINMMFQGDSYTEGYAGDYRQCWAYRAAKYFGNSRTCGLSGQKLSSIIKQYHDCIKGKIKVNAMVISIGINDMADLTSDALIAAWGATLKDYCDELVADGITPIVNRLWVEGSGTDATAEKGAKMNAQIRALGYDGAEFGAVTGYPSNATYYVSNHLSPYGNDLTYDIFINELSAYKQD